MYFYITDKRNRLNQPNSFWLPTDFTMSTLSIGSYNTYKKILNKLFELWVIKEVQKSINQHKSRVITLVDITTWKSLYDKALALSNKVFASSKTDKATDKATDTIIEQENNRTKERDFLKSSDSQATALVDDTPPTTQHNKEGEIAFEKFWKAYPHARKAKKAESKKHFMKQDHKAVMEEVMYLNLKIEFWLQEWKYVPACERWIRDFIVTADNVKQNELKDIVNKLMQLPVGEDRTKRSKMLMDLFWEEKIKELVKAWNKERNWITLTFN